MKKFVRTKLRGLSDGAADDPDPKGVIIDGAGGSSGVKSTDQIETMKRQMDSMMNENAKLKTSVQRLSDDNIYLHDQLEKLMRQNQLTNIASGPNLSHENQLQINISQETRDSIKSVLDENDDLMRRLSMERQQNVNLSSEFDREIKRLNLLLDQSQMENTKLERNLETCLLEMDNLNSQVVIWKKEASDKLSPEEYGVKIETSRAMLDELKEKYAKDLAKFNDELKLAQNEKKEIALKFVEMQSDLNNAIKKNDRSEQILSKTAADNNLLNENLIECNKKLLHTESTLNDMLDLCKDVLQKKTRDEQFEEQKREALEFRLKKFEIKHRQIREENKKLKHFKANACVKLKQAKHLLATDDI